MSGLLQLIEERMAPKLTVLADEESVPLCAIFSAGNVSDTIQLPTTLETARKQYGNLSQFRELLADKGYDSAANRAACRGFHVHGEHRDEAP